jgi:arylsulfatase A-like enzyme
VSHALLHVRLIGRRATAAVLVAAAALGWLVAAGQADEENKPPRPNIIVILSDDVGYSDIGCYGGEIHTPNLDRLAARGLRFTQFYNTARCCPTRASLLSGLYPHQAGVGWMMADQGHPGYRGDLNRRCVTIPEALGAAGYRSYMVGKWHVTRHVAAQGPKHNWPIQRGFDRFYGTIHGAGSFFDPGSLVRDNTAISAFDDPEYQPAEYYYTDAISDQAVRFIAEHQRDHGDRPFFLYVSYTAAHWPMHALEKDIARYQGKYNQGYEAIRQARFERMKALGLIPDDAELPPPERRWEQVRHPRWESRNMEVYAAMLDNMDQGIGRIVAQLEAGGQIEDTLIMYLQDNGGCAETIGRQPQGNLTTRPDKPTLPAMAAGDLQLPQSVPRQTRAGFPIIMGPGVMAGPADTYIAYGPGWANVSNTPLREYKHWVHEGGIATPLVVHWPHRVRAHGKLRHQPSHLIDIMATCLDVAGAKYPERYADHDITPLEGRSLIGALVDDAPIDREALFWEHEGNRAVRRGEWKLVAKGERGEWELYDIPRDRTESNDLSARHPELVEQLSALWQAWAKRAQVLPLGAWRGAQK